MSIIASYLKVEERLPFLVYALKPNSDPAGSPIMSLSAMIPISIPDYTRDVATLFQHVETNLKNPLLAFGSLVNRVAVGTRRARANLAFVHEQELADQLSDMAGRHSIKLVVTPEVPKGELWVTYWKNLGKGIDGGAQVMPDGELLINGNHSSYFLKTTLHYEGLAK